MNQQTTNVNKNSSSNSSTLTLKDFKKKAISILLDKGVLLKPEFLNDYNNLTLEIEIFNYTNKILTENNKEEINESFFSEFNFDKDVKNDSKINNNNGNNKNISSENLNDSKKENKDSRFKNVKLGNVEIVSSYEEYIKKREISDFTMHYNNRFKEISKMLRNRDIKDLTSINVIKNLKDKEQISTIGMIYEINESKNGHMMITLEDRTGLIKAIILKKDKTLLEVAKNLVLDEVIAVTGTAGKDVIFVTDIFFPDIPMSNTPKYSTEEENVVFISDLHVGSKVFYHEEFNDFINWISADGKFKSQKSIVEKIKYLVIPGDLIEGVGIFPGQENEIEQQSVIGQYNILYNYLKRVPEHIKIIICPGNHDAVRIAEPQPPFSKKYLGDLVKLNNLYMISSPGLINIGKNEVFEGFNILLYHGFSFPYYGDKVPEIRDKGGVSNMGGIMKFYLQRRHFAPSHGSTQFIPDIRYDPLIIDKVPDILVTGHIHKISIDNYKGVILINASTWVAPSEYQSRFGLVPDTCRAVMMNLKTRDVKILNFEKEGKKYTL